MGYIIAIIIAFLFTRYGIKLLDTIAECINIHFLSLINDKNIEMGFKTRDFEDDCETVELSPRIGFNFEPDFELEEDDEEFEEDEDRL